MYHGMSLFKSMADSRVTVDVAVDQDLRQLLHTLGITRKFRLIRRDERHAVYFTTMTFAEISKAYYTYMRRPSTETMTNYYNQMTDEQLRWTLEDLRRKYRILFDDDGNLVDPAAENYINDQEEAICEELRRRENIRLHMSA